MKIMKAMKHMKQHGDSQSDGSGISGPTQIFFAASIANVFSFAFA